MLNVSIVLYYPNWQQVAELTHVILQSKYINHIYWIDNSPTKTDDLPICSDLVKYIFNNKNLGYGAAHNIAIRESIYDDIPFHLVINPDILLKEQDIDTMYQFILQNPEIGCLMPKVLYPNGELQ